MQRKTKHSWRARWVSPGRLVVSPWTAARQAPLSMGILQARILRGLLCPPPGDLPHPGIELVSLLSPALAGGFFITSTNWEAQSQLNHEAIFDLQSPNQPFLPLRFPILLLMPWFPPPNNGFIDTCLVTLTEWLQQTNERIDVKFFTKLGLCECQLQWWYYVGKNTAPVPYAAFF